jgi:tRNA nucleotidyltransferase (CCA-adding enzyme)
MNSKVKVNFIVPEEVSSLVKQLEDSGYEAWLVGGCVRDLFLGVTPKDWDITTNANPEKIQEIFEHTFYENDFGTVGVVNDEVSEKIDILKSKEKGLNKTKKDLRKSLGSLNNVNDTNNDVIKSLETQIKEIEMEIKNLEVLKMVEVTPYRIESSYSDNRHPDDVKFSDKLEDDLKRRDFTINALSYNPLSKELADLFSGVSDLQNKQIKAIGNADDRFNEDALRILRAIRFSAQLNFKLEADTSNSITKNKDLLKNISNERIRDEFIKILLTEDPISAFFLAKDLEVLSYISSDLERGIGIQQNGAHKYDVFEHLIRTMQHSADRKWSLDVRLASLFHDISKPETRRWSKEKNNWTFYGHEVVGARVTKKNLERLKFDKKTIDKITTLVRWHMFFSDPDKITLSAVRRIVRNVGEENVWDLIRLRISDRIGMGRPKEKPYRLRQYLAMMDEAMRSPVSVKDLKVNGDIFISELKMKPSRKIGLILNALMGVTLDTPENNNYNFLMKKTKEYMELSDEKLTELARLGKGKIDSEEKKEIKEIHRKHKVK